MFCFRNIFVFLLLAVVIGGEESSRELDHREDIIDVLGIVEYDRGEHLKKPWYWSGNYFYHELRALRKLKLYPGAWFGYPMSSQDNSVFYRMNDKQLEVYRRCRCCSFEELGTKLIHLNDWWIINSDHLTILYRYSRCIVGNDPFYNCPNPCNQVPCKYIRNADPMSCRSVYTENMPMPDSKLPEFDWIFKYKYTCTCKPGFIWLDEKCVPDQWACRDHVEKCGPGVCRVENDGVKCVCPKAYDGEACEKQRNPCETGLTLTLNPSHMMCGLHECERDPTNHEYGYHCVCPQGFVPIGKLLNGSDPRCVDKDECSTLIKPCKHGGACVNTPGSYYCKCGEYFYGSNCEYKKYTTWGRWAQWGPCSKTCGTGKQVSFRECPIDPENNVTMCRGPRYVEKNCVNSVVCINRGVHIEGIIIDECQLSSTCFRSRASSNIKRTSLGYLFFLFVVSI